MAELRLHVHIYRHHTTFEVQPLSDFGLVPGHYLKWQRSSSET